MHKENLKKQIAEYIISNKEKYYRVAYSYVKNADDALDIMQESIYKAVSHVDSLQGISYINTWFYRIIVNTSIDFLRKQKKVIPVDNEVLASFVSEIDDKYENFDLQRAMGNLPEKYRTVVILRYFEDLKIEEIAEILNENTNTIKTRLYKSLKLLRIKMNDYEEI
ncbi:RNA polymerase sigma factor [Clostridium nigeriense]|uniref:RNA polymerase sigma factor n=1 Tax=Clostridium nigeriense TaxID=1805470 RepID=UPI003D346680